MIRFILDLIIFVGIHIYRRYISRVDQIPRTVGGEVVKPVEVKR